MQNKEDMTLEEKIDEILVYQRKAHRMAVLHSVFTFLTFFVLIILPIIGAIYIGDYIASSIGLSMQEIGTTLKKVKSITDLGNVDTLKDFLN